MLIGTLYTSHFMFLQQALANSTKNLIAQVEQKFSLYNLLRQYLHFKLNQKMINHCQLQMIAVFALNAKVADRQRIHKKYLKPLLLFFLLLKVSANNSQLIDNTF